MSQATDRLTEDEIAFLRAEIAAKGRSAVAKALGMSERTVIAMLSGEPVQRLTARLLRNYREIHGQSRENLSTTKVRI